MRVAPAATVDMILSYRNFSGELKIITTFAMLD